MPALELSWKPTNQALLIQTNPASALSERHPPPAEPQQEVSSSARHQQPNDIQGKAGRGSEHMTAKPSLHAAASRSYTLLTYRMPLK